MGRFIIPEYVIVSEVDESLVMLDMRDGHYYTFNESGVDFLKSILDGESLSGAVKMIKKNYQQVPLNVDKEFREFIDFLLKKGLLIESEDHE